MDARTMQNYELGSELLPPILLPLTVTSPIFMAPMAIALRPSMQGESQFFVLLPPGIELRGILCSRTVMGSPETCWSNLPGGAEVQQSDAQNVYASHCNQLPALVSEPFPGYDTIFNSDGIYDSAFNDVFPVVPAPSSHYPQMVNSPMPECLPDANQDSFESDGSASFDIQNPQPILNAAAAASQQSQVMSWMSPNVPHNFVPAPSLPEYAIRFEPATFAPPPLRESHRDHVSTYGSCIATSSRHS